MRLKCIWILHWYIIILIRRCKNLKNIFISKIVVVFAMQYMFKSNALVINDLLLFRNNLEVVINFQ